MNCSGKNPIKRVISHDIKISDTRVETQNSLIDRILKIAYDITIDNHHSEHAESQLTIASKINDAGIEMFHINIILKEMG